MASSEFVPFTHAEKRIFLTQELHPQSCLWNNSASLRLALADIDMLRQALLLVIEHTPGLRVVFTRKEGMVGKRIIEDFHPEIEMLDFSEAGEQAYLDWARIQTETRIPIWDRQPYRLGIADVGGRTAYLFTLYHHIAGDGGASDLVFRRVLQAYEALGRNEQIEFPEPLPLNTAYQAERAYLESEHCEKDKAYWNTLFDTVPKPMDIAGRGGSGSLHTSRCTRNLSSRTCEKLLAFCAENRVSPFRVVLAAISLVLSRLLNQDDLVFGTGTANRYPAELDEAFGMFVSTCSLRMQVEKDDTFHKLVQDASQGIRDTLAHCRYPYDRLVGDLRERIGEVPNLIACTLVEMVRSPYPEYAEAIYHYQGESLIPLSGFLTYPHRDHPEDKKVELSFVYNDEMYEQWRIQGLLEYIEQAILSGTTAPLTAVSDLDFLGSPLRNKLVHTFNETQADWEVEATLHGSVTNISRRFPGRTALVYRGKSLTYSELEARTNSLARTLRKHGARPDTVVGLLADRSLDIIVAQLAILKSGAAFMPIDAGYPDSRIQFMLEDIAAPLILSQNRFIEERDFGGAAIVNMDDPSVYDGNDSELDSGSAPHDLCVAIYTSGSTGKPKGVLLEHRAICNTVNATIRDHSITPKDNIAKHASFSFDASLLEVFAALMSGATLHIIPEEIRLSLSHLNEYYEANGISWSFLTTQLGEQFMDFIDNRSLRTLVIGGEKMRIFTPREYQLINIYGPTECSIYATQQIVTEYGENIPIGKPLANFRIYILDGCGHPQPPGYGGELCISGPGVGRGYHQRDDKTAECFVADPFHPGETMYRTGDLAYYRPDGVILHLGRMDRQVKLRGFRIELGEIENAMLSIDGVTQAAVADFKDNAGHVYLCGYICGQADPAGVTAGLDGKIPPFMIPAHMIHLDEMPINPSGKIDRKHLPEPQKTTKAAAAYVAPETGLEKSLCKIWGEVLDQERVGAEANFFESGGDSLRGVALQLKIYKELGRDVELGIIFECPTPRRMAERLEGEDDFLLGVPPAEPSETYPATVSQQQLFLLNQMKGIGTSYNMPMCIAFEGELDHKRLSNALLTLLERHESLRTAFEIEDGKCVQRVIEDAHLKLDFQQTNGDDPAEFSAEFSRPFDLSRPPLMQARLLAHPDGRHWLLLDFHHIVFDGVSIGIYLRELFALYGGERLIPLKIQHKDVAAWEALRMDNIKAQHEAFWHDLFKGPPEAELPTDFPRPGHQDYQGANYRHKMDTATTSRLRRLAQEQGATLHQIFMAAIAVLAGRWSDSEDICLGTSMSGRDRAGASGIVGMFVRTLPTRIRPEGSKSFSTLLYEVNKQMLAIHEHGEYPISSLYEHLKANRGPGRHPLFDINFVMRNIGSDSRFELDGLTANVLSLHGGTAKFDISFAAEEHDEELVIEVDYRTSLYRRDTIARMTGHLCAILETVAINPGAPVGDIEMLGPEERDTLINRYNPQPTPSPPWATVCRAIEIHAKERPDHVAVKAEDGSFTYAELNALANRAARVIARAGGGKDRIIAVVADRSIWSVAGMLAALKSGSAYVGLDINYPRDRVEFILADTGAPCIVGTKDQLATIDYNVTGIAMDSELVDDDTDPGLESGENGLAYCIFTSGSTGIPKGVLIEHCSMTNFIDWYATHHQITPESGCAAFAAFSFDVSVVQVFAPLVSGATLHVIAEELRRSPQDLDAYFIANAVSHAHFPTQFAEQFMRMCELKSIRHLVVGGDRLRSYRLGDYRLTNEYGPSETTMACLSYDVADIMEKPPVGTPVANTKVYILDSKARLCPIGVPGEICVSGIQVGRGYLNRKELTEKHFVDDPINPGSRMFRTGDRGVWLEDGTVDFIGRMDFQVKIRGYRVEPGEIETCISNINTVQECVVVPLEEPGGNKVLAAYYTAPSEIGADSIKSGLTGSLPEYMIPAHFVQLDRLPLNPNGKVDRTKLPRPEITASATGPLEPRNAREVRIARAWEKVLGHRGFGLFDSFYDIGGDSLSAIALLADLSETFDISASELFMHTTIADQAAHFQEAQIGRSARLLRLKELITPAEDDKEFEAQLEAYEAARESDKNLDTETIKLPEHVLLTGATGTLGIYLLREVLQQTQARVTALVRAGSNEAARRRLAVHYTERFGRDLETDAGEGVAVMAGDLSKPGFGLDVESIRQLEADVDTVLHSAALTSHYGDWETFVAANIESVENLVDFARTGRIKTLHHVSTTSVGAGLIEGRSRVLFTEFDVDMGQESSNLYVRSKLMAEATLEKLRQQGFPASIYRAGNITCDSRTGEFQRNVDDNAFYQQIRSYVNLGVAPDHTDMRNMSYVDQAASAIVTAMIRPGLAGQTFHIHNPHLLSLSRALEDGALGLRMKRVPFQDFVDFFSEHAGCPGFDEFVERILLHLGWQDWLADATRTETVVRVERSATLLERCGFNWKEPEPADLRLFVKQALHDRVRQLQGIPGFAALGEVVLNDIAARIKPEYFGVGTLLQREKKAVDGVRFVVEGMVETYRHNYNGWASTVRVDGPGSCMGEEGVFQDAIAFNSVESLDEVFALQLALEDIRELNMRHPQLGLALLNLANMKTDQAERLFVTV